MVDEKDMSQEWKWFYEQRAKVAVAKLQKRNINAQYVSSRQEALSTIMEMIPEEATVVRGDSVTLDQVGVIAELGKRNQKKVTDPYERDAEGFQIETERRRAMNREAFTCDVFLTGTNAVTLDGKLVSTDGAGNRVSAMLFGPKKVIIVTGANKIVKDLDAALDRIHNIAAPINLKRHYLKHHLEEAGNLPCVRTGMCVDCIGESRVCRYTVIIEGSSPKDRINVVLVGEELGI